jgi:nitrous oxidase accessory protein NosD
MAAVGVVASPAASAAPPPCRVKNATQGTSLASTAGLALTQALAGADDGDRLDIRGTCVGSFTIDKNLDLYGKPSKRHPTVLDGGRAGRVVLVQPWATVRMTDLIVTRGVTAAAGGGGAGIQNSGVLTLTRMDVSDNHTANSGGGILNVGDMIIASSGVRDNSSDFGGGGVYNAGGGRGVIMYQTTIADNRTVGVGGGMFSEGVAELHDSLVTRNFATDDGGGITSVNTLVLDNTPVIDNVPNDCSC